MFNLPQISKEQLDEFLDEIEGLHSVAEFLTGDGQLDYDKLHRALLRSPLHNVERGWG